MVRGPDRQRPLPGAGHDQIDHQGHLPGADRDWHHGLPREPKIRLDRVPLRTDVLVHRFHRQPLCGRLRAGVQRVAVCSVGRLGPRLQIPSHHGPSTSSPRDPDVESPLICSTLSTSSSMWRTSSHRSGIGATPGRAKRLTVSKRAKRARGCCRELRWRPRMIGSSDDLDCR